MNSVEQEISEYGFKKGKKKLNKFTIEFNPISFGDSTVLYDSIEIEAPTHRDYAILQNVGKLLANFRMNAAERAMKMDLKDGNKEQDDKNKKIQVQTAEEAMRSILDHEARQLAYSSFLELRDFIYDKLIKNKNHYFVKTTGIAPENPLCLDSIERQDDLLEFFVELKGWIVVEYIIFFRRLFSA